MGTWTSSVVLSLAVVSTLSFPRPGAEYKIPTVGLGSRAQYYVLHSDGSFKYGYDSGDGLYEQSMAQAPGEVTGAFGYKDPSGADVILEYTADERGFLPSGAHLPVAPESDFGSRLRGGVTQYVAPSSSATSAAASAPVEIAQVRSSLSDDGSYNFGYKTSSSSRSESADTHNSVTGQYTFIADDGINRAINYIAGSETGYIADGDSLPVGPSVPGAESGIPTGRILPVLSEEEANALAAATSGSSSAIYYAAPTVSAASSPSRSPTPSAFAVASTKSVPSGSRSDASYSFSYDAGDSTRSESADADLNVEGSYSFVPPEGHRLTVNYVAGSDTGFVATGDHLPAAPDADFGSKVRGAATAPGATAYSVPSATSPAKAPAAAPATPVEVAQVRSSAGDDGTYNFAYDTSSSSRSESANAQNSVIGQYSFVADDGINREIRYTAGAETGYIAEGDSLPVGPSVPGAESGIPTGRIFPILSEEEANALAAATSGSSSATAYTAPSSSASASSSTSSDASYAFQYDAGDSARQETADADLNIEGSYSFVPPAGHRLTVNYVAGSDTGFVATGAHLPVAPEVAAVPYSAAAAAAPSASVPASPATAVAPASYSPPSPSAVAGTRSAATSSSDASYSFSYDAGDSSRSESADADLNVEGSYSFVPPEGHRLTVNYVAGSDTGFVASGDHLPVAPEVDVVPYSAPAAAAPSASVPATAVAPASYSPPSPSAVASTRSAATSSSDASYSFSYDAGDSSRSESADADLNVEGSYSFVPPQGHRLTVNYIAGSDTGFVATGNHLPVAPEAGVPSQVRGAPSAPGAATYSAPASVTSFTSAAAATPIEVAQVRSSSGNDGSYSFGYKTSSSSRSESADAHNSVTGHYAFIADDGINRNIKYIAGAETGYIAEGDSLPIGPAVPGAESGIPTGRILPILSEEEANALAATSSASGAAPLLKASAGTGASATPADASYAFSFASDSYSRNEEADADGNIVGSYTYQDEDGNEYTVNFVAGRDTGFLPEGFPTPSSATAAGAPASPSVVSAYSAPSRTGSPSAAPSATKYALAGHSSRVVGDVLLHQYDAVNRDKYGYVFTALRR